MALLVTPGQWGDAPQMIEVLDRIRVPRPLGGRPRARALWQVILTVCQVSSIACEQHGQKQRRPR